MPYTDKDEEGTLQCYLGAAETARQIVAEWDVSDPERLKDALDFLVSELSFLLRNGRKVVASTQE